MNRKTISFIIILFSAAVYSQVGIGTGNPQGVFTIDAAKDNPSTGSPTAAQQANDLNVLANGNMGIGTDIPNNKLHISSTVNGALRISDDTEGNGKILVSDTNGVGTWQNSAPSVILNSTTGISTQVTSSFTYLGASVNVTIPGYYLVSPRLITDHTPANCSNFIAYNLSKSPTTKVSPAFPIQDAHFAPSSVFDFIYSTNVALLETGTYYMIVRYSGNCTSNASRATSGENSFTLTLLR
ncbi:hypothetical protein [Chryseobacterium sp. MMS23-Vi53]|uniref:hypothetical protein n=1 Tax=Chryseobacterium sp. MMS23-Vi53 TaxID=3386644 RepID=UPI0039EC2E04